MGGRFTSDRDAGYDLVHARVLHRFSETVAQLGGDGDAMLRAEGIDPAVVAEGRSAVTYRQLLDVTERAARDLACPDFGMRLARAQIGPLSGEGPSGEGIYGPLGAVMRHSRRLGDALDYVCAHAYAHSLAARIWRHDMGAESGAGEGLVLFGHDIMVERVAGRAQAIEQILLLGHLGASELTGGHARARLVLMRHQPVSPIAAYRRAFGCDVRFGESADGLCYSPEDLACPIVAPDDNAYAAATAYVEAAFARQHPPLHAEVRGMVMRRIGLAPCGNAAIADALGLNLRTLHRRLAVEGTTFRQVKDEVRRDMLRYYVTGTDLAFAEISARLGFAEQSVMTRLCHRWFAASPTRLRALSGRSDHNFTDLEKS